MTLEARVRSILADQLGVDPSELRPETLLVDDLAFDSLDLAEVACVLEQQLGAAVGDRAMASLHTVGDLVAAVGRAVWKGSGESALEPIPNVFVRAHIKGGRARSQGRLLRAGRLDPYLVEIIAEDALRSGAGTLLDLEVVPEADEDDLGIVRAAFDWLPGRGVGVRVEREGGGAAARRLAGG